MKYYQLAKPYKPVDIKVLLIGEAPPTNGNRYFYKIPETYKPLLSGNCISALNIAEFAIQLRYKNSPLGCMFQSLLLIGNYE